MALLPENFQLARHLVNGVCPYWRHLLWSLEPVEAPGLGTVGCDKYLRFYIDSAAVKDWSIGMAMLVLIHELVHITNRHQVRGGVGEGNIAADCAANSWLEDLLPVINATLSRLQTDVQLQAPPEWVHPSRFGFPKGLALEEYLQLWEEYKQAHPQAGGSIKMDIGCGKCGSCAHPGSEPGEADSPGDGGPEGVSAAELSVKIRQVAAAVKEYAEKRIGNMPGCLERWAGKELRPPVIPWTQELASATQNAISWAAGMAQQTWKKLSRRSYMSPVLRPGLMSPVPNVAQVIDSSGSMSGNEWIEALSQAQGVIQACCHMPVPTLVVDAAVQLSKKYLDMRKTPFVGGGGTDMVVGIKAALELKPKPKVIIVFTDGFSGWEMEPPHGVKVIVVIVHPNGPKPPAWMRAIYVNNKEVQEANAQ